jgi:hypothetical protein
MRLIHNLLDNYRRITRRLQNVNTGKRSNRHYNVASFRAVDVSNVGRKPPSDIIIIFFHFLILLIFRFRILSNVPWK